MQFSVNVPKRLTTARWVFNCGWRRRSIQIDIIGQTTGIEGYSINVVIIFNNPGNSTGTKLLLLKQICFSINSRIAYTIYILTN